MRANYPSDVTDEQWQVLRRLLPRRARLGRSPLDRERRAVLESDGLSMASLAARLSEVEDGLHDLSALATRRTLATAARGLGATRSPSGRQVTDAECSDRRQSVDSDGGRGRRTRLRCRKEDHRPQATHRCRHARHDPGRGRAWRRLAGSRRILLRAHETSATRSAESRLRRFGVRSLRSAELGEGDVRLDSANGSAIGGSERLCRAPQTLDRRTDLRLDQPLPTKQQRLRTNHRNQRDDDLRHHDRAYVTKARATKNTLKTPSEDGLYAASILTLIRR
jgi:hypothetical protein